MDFASASVSRSNATMRRSLASIRVISPSLPGQRTAYYPFDDRTRNSSSIVRSPETVPGAMARAEQRPVNTCERPPGRGGETFFATPASKKTVENQSIECSITGNGVERNSLAMTRLTLAGTLALTCAVILIPPATASHSGSDHGLAHRPPSQPKSDPKPPAKPAPKPH